jgi:hypothetical protein
MRLRQLGPDGHFNSGKNLSQSAAISYQIIKRYLGGQILALDTRIEGSSCKLWAVKSTGGASGARR